MRIPVQKQLTWWGLAAALLLLAMWVLGQAILPFLIGAGIAYLLDPVADRLEAIGLSRTLAVVLITVLAGLAFLAIIVTVIPLAVKQGSALVATAPRMMDQLQGFLAGHFPDLLPEGGTVRSALSDLGRSIGNRGAELFSTVLGSVRGVVSVIALLVIVPVVTFYLLLDWDKLVAQVDGLLPREHAPVIRRLAGQVDDSLAGFVRGQGTVTAILGAWYAGALMLVGLPFGVFIGLMAAVLSIIPFVGVLIGGATAIGVALFSFWGEWHWIGAVVAIFALGQIVEGNYLQPKIIGGHVGLHPVWLMLALSVFGSLFGFVGLVIAVPLAAALGVLVRYATERYQESALYTGRGTPPEPGQPMRVELVPRGTAARHRDGSSRGEDDAVKQGRGPDEA